MLIYTLLRLLLFALATFGLWRIGLQDWLAPFAGLFIAWALGYVLLGRQRDAAARYLQARAEHAPARTRRTATERDADYEDAADEATRSVTPFATDPGPTDAEPTGR